MSLIHPAAKRLTKGKSRSYSFNPAVRFWNWLTSNARWEKMVLAVLIVITPFLLFYNLNLNPRTWHDEAEVLSLANTLIEDGYYGLRMSDGYQSYGVVQSVGPTFVLPIALAFKVFGAGLVTGRVVAGVFALATLAIFFLLGRALIGQRAALIALIILISVQPVRFLYASRQALGTVPALGFFLAGILLWYAGLKTKRAGLGIPAGLLIGCAILTKSQYLILGLGAFMLIAVLDLLYYRLGAFKITMIVILTAAACYGLWNLWQWFYYGPALYAENTDKLYRLGQVAYGVRPILVKSAVQMILGTKTGHYFLFWGFFALMYAAFVSLRKDIQGMVLGLLLIFTVLCLGFVILWTMPWYQYFIAPLTVSVLLVCKLAEDIIAALARSLPHHKQEFMASVRGRTPLPAEAMVLVGALAGLASLLLWVAPNLEDTVTYDVLDRVGEWERHWPRFFALPHEAADFMDRTAAPGSIIETSEREVAFLTDFDWHSPDQSILIDVIPCVYSKTGPCDYQLAGEYFNSIDPDYLVVGYFARVHFVYDQAYIEANFDRIQVIGGNGFEYEIYRKK